MRSLPCTSYITKQLDRANGQPGELVGVLEAMGTPMFFNRNVEIYGDGEEAEHVYRVADGAARIIKILEDGRRQISAFYLPGQVFGLEAGNIHESSAEAVIRSRLLVVRRSALVALAARECRVANQLWALTARRLNDFQNSLTMLGRKNAHERLATFLLELATRMQATDAIELPMPRQDIADHLGLSIETVSRVFTRLENESSILLIGSRRVILRNIEALAKLDLDVE
jgi:CRP/FNR family nitrogen fixation transcriptional regulator